MKLQARALFRTPAGRLTIGRRFPTCPTLAILAVIPLMAGTVDRQPAARTSFRLDVMPVFFRAGCNSGGCHGAAAGKDGFHLSLFGYDPAGDYWRLIQQIIGRRIDLAAPEQSLLLLKATGSVPHTGGRRFKPDSEYYQTLLRWIQAGAPDDAANLPQVTRISLVPDKVGFSRPGRFSGKDKRRPLP